MKEVSVGNDRMKIHIIMERAETKEDAHIMGLIIGDAIAQACNNENFDVTMLASATNRLYAQLKDIKRRRGLTRTY